MKTLAVLLIFEEPQDLEIYGIFLRNRAYEPLIWNFPGEAINSLETESVSLVIVGQDTPAFEGRQVLEQSHRCHPEVPVLVIGRGADMHFYPEAMGLGATDYLESPQPRDLAWLIDAQILRSKAPRFSDGGC